MALVRNQRLDRLRDCLTESSTLADSFTAGGIGFPDAVGNWLERLEALAKESGLEIAPKLASLRVSVEAARHGVVAPELQPPWSRDATQAAQGNGSARTQICGGAGFPSHPAVPSQATPRRRHRAGPGGAELREGPLAGTGGGARSADRHAVHVAGDVDGSSVGPARTGTQCSARNGRSHAGGGRGHEQFRGKRAVSIRGRTNKPGCECAHVTAPAATWQGIRALRCMFSEQGG